MKKAADSAPDSDLLVCPRCGLHFHPRQEDVPTETQGRPTVLVVEDTDYFLEIAREALSEKFEVKTAKTFSEAWALLTSGKIDLLVLDLIFKGSEGGRTLLEELQPKPCPILIFTARDESEIYGAEWEQLRGLGVDDVVLKGMHVEESLLRKACELLGVSYDEDYPD